MPLPSNASAGDWIKDFINSDNPKFAGKSKKERQKMALAAYYARHQNESVELSEAKLLAHYIGNGNAKGAKVYGKNTHGEHTVKHFVNGVHQKDADYFTNDERDAHGTAKYHVGDSHIIEKGTAKRLHDRLHSESVEQIDELSNTTYKSYSKKSSRDADKHINRFLKGGNEKSLTHAEKRSKGINSAQQLMTRKKMKIESAEYNEADGHIALVNAILDGNRDEANEIFDDVVSSRLNPVIAAKKEELAASMFATEEIEEEYTPLPLTEEAEHGHHHRIHSELTDRKNNLSNDAHNAYMSASLTKEHKKEVLKHVKSAEGSLESAKNKLGSAESADHLNTAAVHITNGNAHLQNVRTYTSLGFRSY